MSSLTATATATTTSAAAATASPVTAAAAYAGTSSYRPEDYHLVSHPRSLQFSTIEPLPRHPHQHHHAPDRVWRPNPSPHTHRTTLDSRYPFVEILPRAEATSRFRHSSLQSPGSIRGGSTRAWVAPGSNLVTIAPQPAPVPASQSRGSTLTPLLSPLSVAQGNDTTRVHYDLRTLPINVRLSARDHTTEGAPERYLPRSDVQHLIQETAFHPSLSSIWVVSSLFPWVIAVEAGHILIVDVLSTIHTALHQRITQREWDQLPQAQQQRTTSIWEDGLALSESGSPPPNSSQAGAPSPWYTRLFPANATVSCCKPKYQRHASEAGILPPQAVNGEEEGNEKTIVLPKRERKEGIFRIDWVCEKTRWGGLVRDDETARRRGVPREKWERTWCLVLE